MLGINVNGFSITDFFSNKKQSVSFSKLYNDITQLKARAINDRFYRHKVDKYIKNLIDELGISRYAAGTIVSMTTKKVNVLKSLPDGVKGRFEGGYSQNGNVL